MTTFASVLDDLLRHDPGRPLVTFYDHGTGERVELSVTTYANWTAKAAGLLVDEHGLERGDRLLLDLPPHWLGTVFLGAAWRAGLTVVFDGPADAVVCGPETLDAWAPRATDLPVLACSLLPMGVRFPDGVPPQVHDVGIEVWAQPDAFHPFDPPGEADQALEGVSQAELMATAAAGSLLTDGGRLLTAANPTSPSGVATFTEPLARGGSMVLVAAPDPDRLAATGRDERVTHTHPARS